MNFIIYGTLHVPVICRPYVGERKSFFKVSPVFFSPAPECILDVTCPPKPRCFSSIRPLIHQNRSSSVHCNTVSVWLSSCVVVVLVAVCLVIACVDLSPCIFLWIALASRHAGSGQRSPHTQTLSEVSGSLIVGEICKLCCDFNAAHFYVVLCQGGHQLWWLFLTFLSPSGLLTNLALGSRQWNKAVVETTTIKI